MIDLGVPVLTGIGKGWSRPFTKHLLLLWLPLVLLLGLVIGLLYSSQVHNITATAEGNGQQWVKIAEHTVNAELGQLHSDVLYLAGHATLQRWLATGDAAAQQQFSRDLLTFAARRGRYDQLRFIDLQGQEQVRINWHGGWAQASPSAELQDKADRYYVRNTLALKRDEIYVSPFDLNIEHGKLEQPIKPMIRFGTPVFDGQGRKRGLIVVNYLGQRLLDQLKTIPATTDNHLWLLNRQGDWLLGPDPTLEWGFMYPQRAPARFEHRFPAAWARMQQAPIHGQFMVEAGLFTYARAAPLQDSAGVSEADWTLVSHLPATALAQYIRPVMQQLLAVFIVLAVLLAVLSGVIVRAGERRRQNEARVRASEARFRGLFDSAPDPIVIVDQTGSITLANARAEKTFGYESDELFGKSIEILVPERFREAHVANRTQYMDNPATRPMGEGAELYGLRKDGSTLPVEISLSPLQTDQGKLVTSIIRDISERKRAEALKQQAQKRYQELITNLPVGVYRNTPGQTGRFLEVNPAMVGMFEADSAEQLLASTVNELYCDPAERAAFSEKILRHGHVNSEEVHLKTLHGREFDAAITAVMKRDEHGGIFFDGIVEDITERKHSEQRIQQLNKHLQSRAIELEAINHELEAFSYSVSHDLRAPLRAMDGFSRTLLHEYSDRLDEKGRDRLNRIRAAAQRMAALIDDMLNLSRISRSEVKREKVDLSRIAGEILAQLQQQDPGRSVRLSTPETLVTEGDARLLRVVMDNLLGNAWKFTGRRADTVIEVGSQNDGDEIAYYVRDNGAGFDMAYADKLFGAFQRLHDSHEFPGTGVGLATVQRVIHKHGGRIWAESVPDQGAAFYFTLAQG